MRVRWEHVLLRYTQYVIEHIAPKFFSGKAAIAYLNKHTCTPVGTRTDMLIETTCTHTDTN